MWRRGRAPPRRRCNAATRSWILRRRRDQRSTAGGPWSARARLAGGRKSGWRGRNQRRRQSKVEYTRGIAGAGARQRVMGAAGVPERRSDGIERTHAGGGASPAWPDEDWARAVYGGAGPTAVMAWSLTAASEAAGRRRSTPGGPVRRTWRAIATVMLLVARRIGEASNPGPAVWTTGFDDPEGGVDMQGSDDEEFDHWGPPPTLVDDGPWDQELADMVGPDGTEHDNGGGDTDAGRTVPEFMSARKFMGARQGMKFGLGNRGVGYYRDAPPVLELAPFLCPLIGTAPLKLNLDMMLKSDAPSAEGGADGGAEATARGPRRRRGPRRARTGPYSCHGDGSGEGHPKVA